MSAGHGALPPGSTLGILGAGQLGRMMALAAAPLGYRVRVFDPKGGPAGEVCAGMHVAPWDDEAALAEFARATDVITYEFENVPTATARFLAALRPLRPGPHALNTCQHRAAEKRFLGEVAGVPTAPWRAASTEAEVQAAMRAIGGPCIVKTARFGYDGKGQVRVDELADAADAFQALAKGADSLELVVEGLVPFVAEASVVVARGVDGTVAPFDLVQNEHEHHILRRTIAPAPLAASIHTRARDLAVQIAAALEYVGVLGIELFVLSDGGLVVNELAPRPHNSGHWTMDACVTSQFEQAVRAAMGLPLGSPARRCAAEMLNLLGDEALDLRRWLTDPRAKVHLYGKAEARPGRKMGHVNLLSLTD